MKIAKQGPAAVLITALALCAGPPDSGAAPAASEDAVKAAVVYKLTKFVSWPEAVFEQSGDNLTICVGRDNPFLGAMQSLRGRSAQGRSVRVLVIDPMEGLERACHVLFVSDRERQSARELLSRAADSPVLTVGEGQAFVEHGGIIALRIEKGRIGFLVNVRASERAGLDISARLLQLATIVDNREA